MKFALHPELRPFSVVDVPYINSKLDKEGWYQDRTRVWERWAKNIMKLTDSPYIYMQLLIHVNFIADGESNDKLNPFQWRHAKLIQSGDESYTPKIPWVIKVISYEHLAREVFIYVDDSRIIAQSELVCWQSKYIFFSICN